MYSMNAIVSFYQTKTNKQEEENNRAKFTVKSVSKMYNKILGNQRQH